MSALGDLLQPPRRGNVPRRAAFDDLRVGQLVAWVHDKATPRIGVIDDVEFGEHERLARLMQADDTFIFLGVYSCKAGDVTILRDPPTPAPPVQVRREDYDALQACVTPDGFVDLSDMGTYKNLHRVIRALIDNADLGDT